MRHDSSSGSEKEEGRWVNKRRMRKRAAFDEKWDEKGGGFFISGVRLKWREMGREKRKWFFFFFFCVCVDAERNGDGGFGFLFVSQV